MKVIKISIINIKLIFSDVLRTKRYVDDPKTQELKKIYQKFVLIERLRNYKIDKKNH
jgi:hypothetical protein